MVKAELIRAVASAANLSQHTTAKVLDALVACIVSAVAAGDKVKIVHLGTFSSRTLGERISRNPKTGEPVIAKSSRHPVFIAGKSFKAACNTKQDGQCSSRDQVQM